MILLKKDFKHGLVALKVSQSDDLWYLSHIINVDDKIRMKTERKIKINQGADTNTKVVRKTVVLTLIVEDVSLTEGGDQLRVKGTVFDGPEDVPHASYHTFGIGLGDDFTLVKQSWPKYQKEKLLEAQKNNAKAVLMLLYDRELAQFSLVRQTGIVHLAELKGEAQKKQFATKSTDFYKEILSELETYNKQYQPSTIVVACSHFWKQYLENILSDELRKKVTFVEASVVNRSVVEKLLARPELKALLADQRLRAEQEFVDVVLKKLKDDEVAYGFDDAKEAGFSGAVSSLGVTESFLRKAKVDGFFEELDTLLQSVDTSQGKIIFLYEDKTAKVIDGLGGVVGVLRWKQN